MCISKIKMVTRLVTLNFNVRLLSSCQAKLLSLLGDIDGKLCYTVEPRCTVSCLYLPCIRFTVVLCLPPRCTVNRGFTVGCCRSHLTCLYLPANFLFDNAKLTISKEIKIFVWMKKRRNQKSQFYEEILIVL
jgi:hypothetical protein